MPLRWLVLVALTLAFTGIGIVAGLSAALLIGAMAAAIVLAARDAPVRIPPQLFIAAQALIGCMIARAIVPSILVELHLQWPIFVVAVVVVLGLAIALGVALTRMRVLPGTTALWGSFPGAATAMTLMAESFGADIRLVAFMQYLRVAVVAVVASLVARIWIGHVGAPSLTATYLAPVDWRWLTITLLIAIVGTILVRRVRMPVAPLLGPMILGAVLQNFAGVKIELPPLLLALAYSIVGWSIGLRFTREILRHALAAMPRILASILTLVAGCGIFAAVLVRVAGLDPLTAYLATSPGGADSVAIIAATSAKVDMPFVMALQMARFLVILAFGPGLARLVAKRLEGLRGTGAP